MYTKIKSTALGFMQIFFGALLILSSIAYIQDHWEAYIPMCLGFFILGLVDMIKINTEKLRIYSGVGFLFIPLGGFKNLVGIDSIFVSPFRNGT